LPRQVSSPGLNLDGIFIPAGAEIGQNPWVLGRNESCYRDADTYRPERWLEEPLSGGAGERWESSWGFGSRSCIGKNLALLELWKASSVLLRMFKFTIVESPEGSKSRDIKQFGFWFAEGFWYKVERRDVPEWKQYDTVGVV
jgi:cytochrome P450